MIHSIGVMAAKETNFTLFAKKFFHVVFKDLFGSLIEAATAPVERRPRQLSPVFCELGIADGAECTRWNDFHEDLVEYRHPMIQREMSPKATNIKAWGERMK